MCTLCSDMLYKEQSQPVSDPKAIQELQSKIDQHATTTIAKVCSPACACPPPRPAMVDIPIVHEWW